VSLRRIATAASTIAIAIVVALAVPVSQLRTQWIAKSCCCPDPAKCHCPDHKPERGTQPSMRACHNTTHTIVAPDAPGFTAVAMVEIAAPARIALVAVSTLGQPHAPPPREQPDAPS
jgi:hypothetical protein